MNLHSEFLIVTAETERRLTHTVDFFFIQDVAVDTLVWLGFGGKNSGKSFQS